MGSSSCVSESRRLASSYSYVETMPFGSVTVPSRPALS